MRAQGVVERRRREPRQGVSAAARASRRSRATSRRTSSSGCGSSSSEQFGDRLYEQGLKVYTTLDLDMQAAAERALENQLRAIEGGRFGAFTHLTYEQYVARGSSATGEQAAPNRRTCRARSSRSTRATAACARMVGGRDYDDSQVQSRHAGAAPAGLDVQADRLRGGDPERPAADDIVDDSPIWSRRSDGTTGRPQNYDGKFEGPMTMRRGLYQSRNIVAIKRRHGAGRAQRRSRWRAGSASRRRSRRIRRSTSAPPTSIRSR